MTEKIGVIKGRFIINITDGFISQQRKFLKYWWFILLVITEGLNPSVMQFWILVNWEILVVNIHILIGERKRKEKWNTWAMKLYLITIMILQRKIRYFFSISNLNIVVWCSHPTQLSYHSTLIVIDLSLNTKSLHVASFPLYCVAYILEHGIHHTHKIKLMHWLMKQEPGWKEFLA